MVLAIYGPTASGKSAVADAIAAQIPAQLISADAAALFRGLEVLTAAPEHPTLLVGVFELDHEVSVAEFQRLAHATIDEALANDRAPVVVGGTGLYLRAALSDLELPPPPQEGARAKWESFYDAHGGVHAHGRLQALDPEAAARVHPNDRRRVVRALELAEAGSSLAGDDLWSDVTRRPTLVFGLDVPDDVLDVRLRARADAMLERGVVEEARAALARPLSRSARKVMGLVDFAELPPDEARDNLVANNRRLARYQRKWMRRIPGLITLDGNRPPSVIATEIVAAARTSGRVAS
ncbi:MAG TPA: tRNA (adenosine(37)-N6)-dimethylallyltransferase MiaA [Gaiellaceae bacterium]